MAPSTISKTAYCNAYASPAPPQRRPYRRRDQRDKADQHKDKNDLRPHQDILNRLADRILARPFQPTPLAAVMEGYGNFFALPIWERTLQALFYACFVAHSIELKLIDLEPPRRWRRVQAPNLGQPQGPKAV